VSNEEEVVAMIASIRERAGTLDILVNNACNLGLGYRFLDTPAEFFDSVMAVNARGYFLCAREAARLMIETATPGAIVNIGSITATRTMRDRLCYIASKGAVESMTRAMAVELADVGIRVNAVLPGYIHTDRWETMPEEAARERRANVPLGKEAYPKDIGHAVAFLASEAAECITGALLPITGGKDVQMLPAFLEAQHKASYDPSRRPPQKGL
jgi:3-oxoacyl-[acyl-carrier protein] reductase